MNPIDELAGLLAGIGKGRYIGPVEGVVVEVDPLCVTAFDGQAVLRAPKVSMMKMLGAHSRSFESTNHLVAVSETDSANDGGEGAADHTHALNLDVDCTQTGVISHGSLIQKGDTVLLLPAADTQKFYIIGVVE